MLTYRILNVYFQYLKCLLTLFLITNYNILKNIHGPIQLKNPSLTRICDNLMPSNKHIMHLHHQWIGVRTINIIYIH